MSFASEHLAASVCLRLHNTQFEKSLRFAGNRRCITDKLVNGIVLHRKGNAKSVGTKIRSKVFALPAAGARRAAEGTSRAILAARNNNKCSSRQSPALFVPHYFRKCLACSPDLHNSLRTSNWLLWANLLGRGYTASCASDVKSGINCLNVTLTRPLH